MIRFAAVLQEYPFFEPLCGKRWEGEIEGFNFTLEKENDAADFRVTMISKQGYVPIGQAEDENKFQALLAEQPAQIIEVFNVGLRFLAPVAPPLGFEFAGCHIRCGKFAREIYQRQFRFAKSEQMADLKEWQKAEGAGDFFRCPKEIPVPSLKPVFVTLIDRNNFLEKNRADWQIARVTPTLNRIISQP